jgi:Domain of unknown function (DUF4430)
MNTRIGTLAVLTSAIACAPAYAGSDTDVKLRVEGAKKTIFEGRVATEVHEVTGDSSGPHTCDSTNGGANATPAPTPTGALDSASEAFDLDWSGTWSDSFEDFSIDEIGGEASTATEFWGVAVNGESLQVGGCQFQLTSGDEVLWAFDMFNKKFLLELKGRRRVRAGKRFKVRVTDGQTGDRVRRARVGGKRTNRRGIAKLRFRKPGVRRIKAKHPNGVRSNRLRIRVRPRR